MFTVCWTIGATLLVIGVAWCLMLWLRSSHDPYGLSVALAFPGVVLAMLGLAELLLTAAARLIYWWSNGG